MFPTFHRTHMLTPTAGERLTDRPIAVLSLFFAVFLMGSAVQTILAAILTRCIPAGGTDHSSLVLLVQLFSTAGMVATVMVWCRQVERRSPASLGLTCRGAVAEYTVGMVLGVGLLAATLGLCVLTGAASVATATPNVLLLILFLIAFLIQGFSEELLCRAYLMVSLSRGWPLWACAVTNALLFSLLHIANPGVTPVALINIFLFGVFASVLTLRRGSIWMVSALHSLWNFAQGNLFGIPVSGLNGSPSPLVTTLYTDSPVQALLSGGSFGVEGGLAFTAVLAVALLAVCLLPTKRAEINEDWLEKKRIM